MRDLIVSFLLIALMIGGWLVFDNYSYQSTTSLSKTLDDNIIPLTEKEDWEDASSEYDAFEKQWSKYKKISLFFLEKR